MSDRDPTAGNNPLPAGAATTGPPQTPSEERPAGSDSQPSAAAKFCPQCGLEYDAALSFCPKDGNVLQTRQGEHSLVGQILGRHYRILELLGEGGMGQVFLAEHVRIGRRCAIKVMRPALVRDPAAVGRFGREAMTAGRINHRNAAAVYDFGETEDGLIYIVMEHVEGEPLAQRLARDGSLPAPVALTIALQITEALVAAHRLGIIHRDLKPENILVGRDVDGRELVKVVDFGIAKAVNDEGQATLTKTGYVLGTLQYMSPEQLIGEHLDGRSDIYSLGCILFEMLTGERTFAGPSGPAAVVRRLTEPPPTARGRNPDVPEAIDALVTRMLARAAADRFQTAEELRAALLVCLGVPTGSTLSTAAMAPPTGALFAGGGPAPATSAGPPAPHQGAATPQVAAAPPAATAPPSTAAPPQGGGSTPPRADAAPGGGTPPPLAAAPPQGAAAPPPAATPPQGAAGPPSTAAPPPAATPRAAPPVAAALPQAATPPQGSAPPQAATPPQDAAPSRGAAAPPPSPADGTRATVPSSEGAAAPRAPAPPAPPAGAGAPKRPVQPAAAAASPARPPVPAAVRPGGGQVRRRVALAALSAVAVLVVAYAVLRVVRRPSAPGAAEAAEQPISAPGTSAAPAPRTSMPPASPGTGAAPSVPRTPATAAGATTSPGTEHHGTESPVEPASRAEAPAAPATMRILGTLPAGAAILLDGQAAGGQTFRAAAGHHTVTVVASGFEAATWTGRLAAGETHVWRVSLRPVPAPPPAPALGTPVTSTPAVTSAAPPPVTAPSPSPAAATPAAPTPSNPAESEEATRTEMSTRARRSAEDMAAAITSRDMPALRRAWPGIPGEAARRWREFLQSPDNSAIAAHVQVVRAPVLNGGSASVPFSLAVEFTNRVSGRGTAVSHYTVIFARQGTDWVVTSIRPGGG